MRKWALCHKFSWLWTMLVILSHHWSYRHARTCTFPWCWLWGGPLNYCRTTWSQFTMASMGSPIRPAPVADVNQAPCFGFKIIRINSSVRSNGMSRCGQEPTTCWQSTSAQRPLLVWLGSTGLLLGTKYCPYTLVVIHAKVMCSIPNLMSDQVSSFSVRLKGPLYPRFYQSKALWLGYSAHTKCEDWFCPFWKNKTESAIEVKCKQWTLPESTLHATIQGAIPRTQHLATFPYCMIQQQCIVLVAMQSIGPNCCIFSSNRSCSPVLTYSPSAKLYCCFQHPAGSPLGPVSFNNGILWQHSSSFNTCATLNPIMICPSNTLVILTPTIRSLMWAASCLPPKTAVPVQMLCPTTPPNITPNTFREAASLLDFKKSQKWTDRIVMSEHWSINDPAHMEGTYMTDNFSDWWQKGCQQQKCWQWLETSQFKKGNWRG